MLLQVKDLSIIYGSGAPTVQHVSFDVDAGEVLAIVGESGSGKTTVIRAIQMALPASGRVAGGQILFRNQDLYALPKEKQRAISGKDIAMISRTLAPCSTRSTPSDGNIGIFSPCTASGTKGRPRPAWKKCSASSV